MPLGLSLPRQCQNFDDKQPMDQDIKHFKDRLECENVSSLREKRKRDREEKMEGYVWAQREGILSIRYDTIPYHTIPYHTIPYHIIL